ncbi:hypothetical protein V3F56_02870 [Moorellaceae bacterium AZ2]
METMVRQTRTTKETIRGGKIDISSREEVFRAFSRLPYVHSVHATVSQGNVKHYNICIKTDKVEIVPELISLWPYCTVSSKDGEVLADYLVRPEEVKDFAARLSGASCLAQCIKQKSIALIFNFKRPLTEEFKRMVFQSIRGTDRLVWGDMRMAVVLPTHSEEAVRAVETRLRRLLREYYGSEEAVIMEYVS